MSYNIDHIEVLSGALSIRVADLRRLRRALKETAPKNCFLDDLASKLEKIDEPPKEMTIDSARFWWHGEGSGNSYSDVFLPAVVPCLRGTADLVLTWEGGDSVSGLRIADGKATECKVVQTLAPRDEAQP